MGYSGPDPIEWSDIDAFVRRSGTALSPFEIEWIEMLDDLYLDKAAEQSSTADQNQAIKDGLKSMEKRDHG